LSTYFEHGDISYFSCSRTQRCMVVKSI
jgi:hypothetical protein